MKQRFLLLLFSILLIVTQAGQEVIPPTFPEFLNATLTRAEDRYTINTLYRVIKLVNVPDVIQSTTYTCGPVAMQSVLHYVSLQARESDVMKASGTIPNRGTGPIMLENGFKNLAEPRGLSDKIEFLRMQNMTLDQLEKFVQSGQPVIALLQNFKPPQDSTPYTDYNNRGHYMVIIGEDDDYFYFQDPRLLNNVMYIKKNEFVDRWHDQLSTQQRLAVHVGIVIRNKDGSKPKGNQKIHYLLD